MDNVDLNRLKKCADSAEIGYPGIAELYLRITGDTGGSLDWGWIVPFSILYSHF